MINSQPFSLATKDENGIDLPASAIIFSTNGQGGQINPSECWAAFLGDLNSDEAFGAVVLSFNIWFDPVNSEWLYDYSVIRKGMEKYVTFFQSNL